MTTRGTKRAEIVAGSLLRGQCSRRCAGDFTPVTYLQVKGLTSWTEQSLAGIYGRARYLTLECPNCGHSWPSDQWEALPGL